MRRVKLQAGQHSTFIGLIRYPNNLQSKILKLNITRCKLPLKQMNVLFLQIKNLKKEN